MDDIDPIAKVSDYLFALKFLVCCDFIRNILVTYHYFFFSLKKIGAINNIVRRPDGKLTAFNTDYIGAISAIEDGLRGLMLYKLYRQVLFKQVLLFFIFHGSLS